MPKTGVVQVYDGLIADMRKEGHTLQEIGDHCRVSRERIRQVLENHYHNVQPDFLTEEDAAKLLGVASGTLANKRKRGLITPIRYGFKIFYDSPTIERVRDLIYKPCRLCGKITKNESYCPECRLKVRRNRYLVMTLEEKKAHLARCRTWRERVLESKKEIWLSEHCTTRDVQRLISDFVKTGRNPSSNLDEFVAFVAERYWQDGYTTRTEGN